MQSSSSLVQKPVATAQATAAAPTGPIAFVTISQIWQQSPHATPAQITALLLKLADDVVAGEKAMGASGCVVWDESADDLQDLKYVGDPRLMPKGVNVTTMEQFFRRLRAGGDTGVCVRPGWLMRDAATNKIVYSYADQYAWSMIAKAAWARDHYGIRYVYADSTVGPDGLPLGNEPLVLLKTQLPDVQWFLENVYRDDRYRPWGRFCDPRLEKPIPDDGFAKLVGCMDVVDELRFDDFVAAARRGDRLLYYGWWNSPWNDFIRRVYARASNP